MIKKIFVYSTLLFIIILPITTVAESEIKRVELNAITLGGSVSITLTGSQLSATDQYGLFSNRPCEVTRQLTVHEQERVANIFAAIDLDTVGTLERPSVEAASDGDLDTGLRFITEDGEYESNGFDMGNPMPEYRELVNFMYDQECTGQLELKESENTAEEEREITAEAKADDSESTSLFGKITSFFKRLGESLVGLF